jgi:hypothetical protein
MSKRTFCTIVTNNYLPYAYALNESILKHGEEIEFKILVTDLSKNDERFHSIVAQKNFENISFYDPISIQENEVSASIYSKYHDTNMDVFRWSNKPVFINFLLSQGYDKVIYVDSDIFFYSDYTFIFNDLDKYSVILSPHWRASDPYRDPVNFEKNFTEGIYNGGFIAVSKEGRSAMDWWAKACEYKCVKLPSSGLYDDQKYLDFLHSKFENIGVLSNRGCNIAGWNRIECQRKLGENGKVLINDKWEVVFIHVTKSTMRAILILDDRLLKDYLQEYINTINKYSPNPLSIDKITTELQPKKMKKKIKKRKRNKLLAKFRQEIRLRTRLRKFIEG